MFLITLLAVVGIALATAATVAAAAEQGFIESVDSLGYYAIDRAGCAQDTVDVGYRECGVRSRR
jgi:hypothetical protein